MWRYSSYLGSYTVPRPCAGLGADSLHPKGKEVPELHPQLYHSHITVFIVRCT